MSSMIETFKIMTLTPNLVALRAFPEDFVCMPIINAETKEVTKPNFVSHHKFAVPLKFAKELNKDSTYKMILIYLSEIGIEDARLKGDCINEIKCGYLSFDNVYQTSVRLWSSRQVGSKIVYEVTVTGYP